ncbi:unnamed protein product, partial [Gulo gulo]
QDLLKALSGEVSGLRIRGARKVALGGGGHSPATPKRGVGKVSLGGSRRGSFFCFLHRYWVTYGDVTWAYILLAGESRVEEGGGGGWKMADQAVISIVPPALPEPTHPTVFTSRQNSIYG